MSWKKTQKKDTERKEKMRNIRNFIPERGVVFDQVLLKILLNDKEIISLVEKAERGENVIPESLDIQRNRENVVTNLTKLDRCFQIVGLTKNTPLYIGAGMILASPEIGGTLGINCPRMESIEKMRSYPSDVFMRRMIPAHLKTMSFKTPEVVGEINYNEISPSGEHDPVGITISSNHYVAVKKILGRHTWELWTTSPRQEESSSFNPPSVKEEGKEPEYEFDSDSEKPEESESELFEG
ncbi:MAG: hypothetical protein ACOCQD_02385 [archaeon]